MKRKPTYGEREIAKALGISDAQLFGLLSIKGRRGSANVGHHLLDKGLVVADEAVGGRYVLSPAGEELIARARTLGY